MAHIVHEPAESPGFYSRLHDKLSQKMERKNRKRLRTLTEAAEELMALTLDEARLAHPGLGVLRTARSRLVVGMPALRIVELAEAEGASMIVMGSRGRTASKSLLLGSRAERVMRLSPVTVTIVRDTYPTLPPRDDD